MCKRNCVYCGGTVKKWNKGERSCNYSTAMEGTNQKYRTRTKLLWIKVEKKHPDWPLQKKQKWVTKYLQGENCPFYEPVEEEKKPAAPAVPPPEKEKKKTTPPNRIDEATATELYGQGMNDAAIARTLGVTEGAVWNWRRRRKLPANGKRGGDGVSKRKYNRKQICELLEDGQTVRQVADFLHCAKDTVYRIARAEGFDIHEGKKET